MLKSCTAWCHKTKVVVYGGPFGNMVALSAGWLRDRTSQVLEMQKRLSRLGYMRSLDGIYGEGMKAALIKFKKDNQLPLNHYVDWETYKSSGNSGVRIGLYPVVKRT